jgi:hypothetical protein
MKKFSLAIILFGAVFTAFAQKEMKSTSSFTILGDVKSPLTNHLGEKKSESKGLKGVLLKDILSSVEINSESPKVLSEYYFVCKANDGYTVVYSWNELFNTATGDSSYIVTEKEGKPASAMDDSILMIAPKDFKTGRRHVKALTTIEVRRAK